MTKKCFIVEKKNINKKGGLLLELFSMEFKLYFFNNKKNYYCIIK
jgi:hypothetical protein